LISFFFEATYAPHDLSLKLSEIFHTPPEFWVNLQEQYDQSDKSRGTDSPFYQLMTIMGDAMLKLIGVQSNNEYQPRAIVLKEKKLYPDIVAFPKNDDREIIMIEFQGYKEPMMRYMFLICALLWNAQKISSPFKNA
jgi:hypothetical protein